MIDAATLSQWRVAARRDDWHTKFVGSDIRQMLGEIERLQNVIDSRPAINAGLPESYIKWSHSIYEMEAARLTRAAN